jgi:putative DNA-invertase from lambdoid prophage Rac
VDELRECAFSLHLLDLGGDISGGLSKLFLTITAAFAEARRDPRDDGLAG